MTTSKLKHRPAPWADLGLQKLMDMRISDLGLKIEGTWLQDSGEQLCEELQARNIRIKPYFWLSDDWFTPDGYTGIAMPFYLAHPRLTKIERAQIGEVEGGTTKRCMMILRHEAGHVLDHAFNLHRRRKWQRLFGRSSHRYPSYYRPNPESRRHVRHLEYWYAQSHPDEDFAETFAVWLTPRSAWRKAYSGWHALKKLTYVDELVQEIAGQAPAVRTRAHLEPVSGMKKTLRDYYERKRNRLAPPHEKDFDDDLFRLFTPKKKKGQSAASAFLRAAKGELVRKAMPWVRGDRYLLDHVHRELTDRARELKLFVPENRDDLREQLGLLLVKHATHSLYRRRRWVEM